MRILAGEMLLATTPIKKTMRSTLKSQGTRGRPCVLAVALALQGLPCSLHGMSLSHDCLQGSSVQRITRDLSCINFSVESPFIGLQRAMRVIATHLQAPASLHFPLTCTCSTPSPHAELESTEPSPSVLEAGETMMQSQLTLLFQMWRFPSL